MRALAILCLFLVLISAATPSYKNSAGRCNYCTQDIGLSCEHKSRITCKAGRPYCTGAKGETNIVPNHNFSRIQYDCGTVKHCLNGDFSINAAKEKILHVGIYCCKSEYCNVQEPEYVRYEDLKPNGLQCPACFGEIGKTTCNPKEMVNCVGNQTRCVKMTAKVNYGFYLYVGDLTINGCATPDVCTLKYKDAFNFGSFSITNRGTSCNEAMPSSDQPDLEVKGV